MPPNKKSRAANGVVPVDAAVTRTKTAADPDPCVVALGASAGGLAGALQVSKEQLTAVMDNISEGIIIADDQGVVNYWNPAALAMFGYTNLSECQHELARFADTFEFRPLSDDRLLPPEEWPISRVLRGEVLRDWQFRVRRPDQGWEKIIANTGWLIQNQINEQIVFISTSDISKSKKFEEALRKAEYLMSEGQKIAHLGTFEYNAGTQQTTWSEEEYRIYGLDPDGPSPEYDDMLARCIHPDDRDTLHQVFTSAMQSGSVYELEHRIVRPDGSIRWVYDLAHPYFNANGNLIRYIGTTLDITERKQTETSLQENSTLLRVAGHVALFGGWSVNLADGKVAWSDEVARIHEEPPGYSPALTDGINYYAPEWREKITAVFGDCVRDGTPYDEEMEIITSRGRRVWVRTIGEAVRDAAGEITAVQGAFQDISEQNQTEKTLRESEQRYRLLSDTMLHGIVHHDADGSIFEMNPAAERILGRSREEFLGSSSVTVEHQTIRENGEMFPGAEHPVMVALQTGQPVSNVVMGVHNPKVNEYRWISIGAVPIIRSGDTEPHEVFAVFEDITERKRSENEILAGKQFLQKLADNIPDMVGYWSKELKCAFANEKYFEWFGKTPQQMLGISIQEFMGAELYTQSRKYIEGVLRGEAQHFERDMVKANGEAVTAWTHYIPDTIQGEVKGFFVQASDISAVKQVQAEKNSLQNQLLQAQKLESIGRLAGGVAHDFNNKLMVILGYSELASMELDRPELLKEHLKQITIAAEHSRDMTMQLLAFSRQQAVVPRTVNANDLIEDSRKSLSRLIGEDILFVFTLAADLWLIMIDPVQLDQIIMNMAVNSRDAMPNGGTFTIETCNMTLDGQQSQFISEARPGDFVCINFIDNGIGMDEETLSHIFEPFFTTKEQGKGTGLGLATIYGITRQNSGFIEVNSKPGRGTCFSVYFPRQITSSDTSTEGRGTIREGTETILLVEDEEGTRGVTSAFLKKLGYNVYEAETPGKALALVENSAVTIDLVLTDIVMPEMNGIDLVKTISGKRPGIKAIYASGYTSAHITTDLLAEDAILLQKPYNLHKLSNCLKKILAGNQGA